MEERGEAPTASVIGEGLGGALTPPYMGGGAAARVPSPRQVYPQLPLVGDIGRERET